MPRVLVSLVRRRWRARDAINVGERGARLHDCADFDVYFLYAGRAFGLCEEFHSPKRHQGHQLAQEKPTAPPPHARATSQCRCKGLSLLFRKRGSEGGSPRARIAFTSPTPAFPHTAPTTHRHASQTPFHPANVPIRGFIEEQNASIALSNRAIVLLNRGIGLPNRAMALSNGAIEPSNRSTALRHGGIGLLNGAIALSNRGIVVLHGASALVNGGMRRRNKAIACHRDPLWDLDAAHPSDLEGTTKLSPVLVHSCWRPYERRCTKL